MMIQLMVAGIGLILIGLGAIGYGIPVKEFGFGNTLILAGTIASCTGVILLALHAAVRELTLALGGRDRAPAPAPAPFTALKRPAPSVDETVAAETSSADFQLPRDRPAARGPAESAQIGPESAEPPWQQDAARERARLRAAAPTIEPSAGEPAAPLIEPPLTTPEASDALAAPEPGRGRRSLLFSSSRRERERAALASGSTPEAEDGAGQPGDVSEPRRIAFDEAWPEPDRARGEPLRRLRPADSAVPARPDPTASAGETAAPAERPVAPAPEQPAGVMLLKSGEVDGMSYSLYSDGSIEAQMPEGMMRFASIEELRSYLDQRS